MVQRKRSDSLQALSPSRLLCDDEHRQVFQNEQGSLLEICRSASASQDLESSYWVIEDTPLPAGILDDERGNPADDASFYATSDDCFRKTLSNDNRLYLYHVKRAVLRTVMFTVVFAGVLVSCDFCMRSYENAHRRHYRRRTQTTLSAAIDELFDMKQSLNESASTTGKLTNVTSSIINSFSNATAEPSSSPAPSPSPSQRTFAPFSFDDDSLGTDNDLFVLLKRRGLTDGLSNSSSPQFKAYRWMTIRDGYDIASDDDNLQLLQRYATAVLDFAFHPKFSTATFADTRDHECDWKGVACGSHGAITSIKWPAMDLRGSIPRELGLLQSLRMLDLGGNDIAGKIPEELYTLAKLTSLYIHQNALTGSLSESIGNLYHLENFYAYNNSLTGTIPSSIGSLGEEVRPLRYMILASNNLVGTIPNNLRLRNLHYLDLGHNELEGSLPSDWLNVNSNSSFRSLRHLFLDHNKLTGTLPTNFATLGEGKLMQMYLNDNRFSGTVPGGYEERTFLQQVELQHNDFDHIDQDVCNLAVWVAGEMASLRADCKACSCKYFCQGGAETRRCFESNQTNSSLFW
ncbi:hypothetical protein MPSEU_000451300 [Mayamaea pseudoterrestris]|nr:hypothetical protein MPSEU_000451300 [Mayamaea pseudoterrestris]